MGVFPQAAEGGIKCLNFVYRWEGLVYCRVQTRHGRWVRTFLFRDDFKKGVNGERSWYWAELSLLQLVLYWCGRISGLRWPRAAPTGQGPRGERTGESEKRCSRVETCSCSYSSSQEVWRVLSQIPASLPTKKYPPWKGPWKTKQAKRLGLSTWDKRHHCPPWNRHNELMNRKAVVAHR